MLHISEEKYDDLPFRCSYWLKFSIILSKINKKVYKALRKSDPKMMKILLTLDGQMNKE